MGARYVPCIRKTSAYPNASTTVTCPTGATSSINPNSINPQCNIQDICGLSKFSNPNIPDQWYRFIIPIFLHGGIIHLLFNLGFQLRTGIQMEKDFGWWRLGIIYFSSGTFGFIFGATFAENTPSVGCSGALYGKYSIYNSVFSFFLKYLLPFLGFSITFTFSPYQQIGLLACLLLDLIQNWKLIINPVIELFKMLGIIIISLAIGFLPYIDNFAHMGGFLTGIVSGLVFMPSITFGKWDKRRKRLLALISLPILIVMFYVTLDAFYKGNTFCPYCKYLNCLPIPGSFGCDAKTGTL